MQNLQGEVVRIVLEDLTKQGLLFSGNLDRIAVRDCISMKLVADIEKSACIENTF
jgi:hypothetical protein